jgi:hypothetical protein
MAEARSQKRPPDVSVADEIARNIRDPNAAENLKHLYLALEAVQQQARTLSENIARELATLGLPAPDEQGGVEAPHNTARGAAGDARDGLRLRRPDHDETNDREDKSDR